MSESLEALETLQRHRYGTLENFDNKLSIIEKELKALEIINTKEVNVALLKNPCVSLKEYNVIIKDQIGKPFRLTKEEYDLLKEELL